MRGMVAKTARTAPGLETVAATVNTTCGNGYEGWLCVATWPLLWTWLTIAYLSVQLSRIPNGIGRSLATALPAKQELMDPAELAKLEKELGVI